MIKEKFLQVLLWFRDHFRFLLEVVVRLSLGIEKKQLNQEELPQPEEVERKDGTHD